MTTSTKQLLSPAPAAPAPRTRWSDLEVWTLENGVFGPLGRGHVLSALDGWRRGARRGGVFVQQKGTRALVRRGEVDWTDFPSDFNGS